jgi:hypothetical protein
MIRKKPALGLDPRVAPVFRKDHAQTSNLDPDPIPVNWIKVWGNNRTKYHPAVVLVSERISRFRVATESRALKPLVPSPFPGVMAPPSGIEFRAGRLRECREPDSAKTPIVLAAAPRKCRQVGETLYQEIPMKLNSIASALGLIAASALLLPSGAQARYAVRGGAIHAAGFRGGMVRPGWHGAGTRWAGGYHGGYYRGGRYYGGWGWGAGAAAAGLAAGAAASTLYNSSTCYQQRSVWNGAAYVTQWVRVC